MTMNYLLRKHLTTAWLVLLAPLWLLAQPNLSEKLPVDGKVTIGKLDNGLTYYIRQNKKPEKKVELRLVVNAGSLQEDDDQQGLAHMAEHMAFNGTKNFKENDIISYLQSIGVGFGNDLNAYTSFNETVYMLPIPIDKKENLSKGFQILEDWAHQVTYTDKDIDDERNVILEESRLGQGAGERMRRQWLPGLLAGSKYAVRLPIGLDSIIQHFPNDAIRRFYREWYRPDLMAVMVVGDITLQEAEAYIKKHFAHIKMPANPRPRVLEPLLPYQQSNAVVVTDKEATSYSTSIYFSARKTEPSTTLGEYRDDIVRSIFASLINQRLQELTQQANPPFLSAGMGYSDLVRGYEQPYLFVANGNNDAKKSVASALEELERVKRFGFTEAELDRVKKRLMASMERQHNERDKQESEDLIEEYIRHYLEGEAIPGIENEFKYYQALMPGITLADINKKAKAFAEESGNFFAMHLGPDADDKSKLPTPEELVALPLAAAKKDVKPYEEKAIAENLLAALPKPGKVVKETTDAKWGTTTWELSNGIKVTLKPTTLKNDQILMGARRPGGSGNYGAADKLNVNYATAVADAMGAGAFSPTDLQKALSGKVASARTILGPTFDGLSGSSSVKDLETMLQLLHLKTMYPRIDTGLYQSFVQRNKAQMTFAMASPQTAFIDSLIKRLYDNHPNAPIAVPRPEYFDAINMDRALEIYQERFADFTGMHFVFVGSLDLPTVKPLVETYLGSLPVSGKATNWKDNGVRFTKGKQQLDFYKGKAEQSLIFAVYSGEIRHSEALEMQAEAISEILNIRIIEELREKIQGIYSGGSNASVSKLPYQGYQFLFQLPCGPDKIDTLLYAMNTEIELLKKNGPRIEDLNKVKQQWIEAHKTSLQENGTWLSQMLQGIFPGAEADRFLNYEKYVNALTIKDIQRTANLIFDGKNVLTAILRPEAKQEKAADGGGGQ